MENTKEFFNKKTIVSFVLSILVVLVHIKSFGQYEYSGTLGIALKSFGNIMSNCITPVAIRLFFMISGVLFYRNYTYKTTIEKYKSRFKSLVIPYFIWCSLYTFLMMAIHYTPIGGMFEFDVPFSIHNLIMGVIFNDFYSSFWFIFNLIIFTFLCPVIYTLLKNKYVGAIVVIATIVLYCFGIMIPEMVTIGGTEYVAFWRADSIVFYLIGAYIGIHFFDFFAKKKNKVVSIISVFVIVACVVYEFFRIKTGIDYKDGIRLLVMIAFCFAFWFAFDLFKYNEKPKNFCNYSFMMFALNFYIGAFLPQIIYMVLPKSQIFALVNFVITLVVEVVAIVLVSTILDKKMHKLYAILTGGR